MMEKNERTRKLLKRLLGREEVRIREVRAVANDLITLAVVRETIVTEKLEVIDAAQLERIVTTSTLKAKRRRVQVQGFTL